MKDFEPFKNLWITTSDWMKWHESWMNDPLTSIDAEQCEKQVSDAFKTMHKCTKTFKDIPGRCRFEYTVDSFCFSPKSNVYLWYQVASERKLYTLVHCHRKMFRKCLMGPTSYCNFLKSETNCFCMYSFS